MKINVLVFPAGHVPWVCISNLPTKSTYVCHLLAHNFLNPVIELITINYSPANGIPSPFDVYRKLAATAIQGVIFIKPSIWRMATILFLGTRLSTVLFECSSWAIISKLATFDSSLNTYFIIKYSVLKTIYLNSTKISHRP